MDAQQGNQRGEQRIVVVVRNETDEPQQNEPLRLEWWFIPALLLLGAVISVVK
ncbi:hypothetical protein ACFV42_23490 [Streptomyces solisilvae]|uniref:hypothetical protein n=1 Tax=Streptomyces malaysiensis TaxID=92644 RepID=UPI0036994830